MPAVAEELLLKAARVEQVVEVADLGGSAETCDGAREAHHRQDLAPRAHAGVARRPRRVGDHLQLESEARVR